MIKLKDLLFETKVAHTQKSLQWVAQGFIPMYPKIMKQVLGDVPITALHNIDWYNAKVMLPKVLGKKKSISTLLRVLHVLIQSELPLVYWELVVVSIHITQNGTLGAFKPTRWSQSTSIFKL